MAAGFHIQRKSTGLVTVVLRGGVSGHDVAACESELRAQLTLAQPHSLVALMDLREVTGYSLEARESLVALQNFLGGKAALTAYVGDSAQQRGLSLWVCHVTIHRSVRCFARCGEAVDWLSSDLNPITGVRPLAPAGARDRGRKKAG